MMTLIIRTSITIIVLFSVAFLLYGISLIVTIGKRKGSSLPFPFNSMYRALKEIYIIEVLLEYLQRSFYLVYVNKVKSEVLASLCVTLLPAVVVLLFTIFNSLSPVWYLSVMICILCMAFPFYALRSYVTKKALLTRIQLLKSFTSFVSLLSRGTIATSAEDMIFSTYGSIREIYKEFLRIYRLDRREAYDFLRYISGDNYTHGVIECFQLFDEEGEEPSREVNKICKQGIDIFNLQLLGFKKFTDLKLSSCVVLGASIGLKYFGTYLGEIMNFQYNETLGYIAIVGTLLSLTLCFVFESNV